jgi:hypothetical protein
MQHAVAGAAACAQPAPNRMHAGIRFSVFANAKELLATAKRADSAATEQWQRERQRAQDCAKRIRGTAPVVTMQPTTATRNAQSEAVPAIAREHALVACSTVLRAKPNSP